VLDAKVVDADFSDSRLVGADLRGVDGDSTKSLSRAISFGSRADDGAAHTFAAAGASSPTDSPDLQIAMDGPIASVVADPTGELLAVAGRSVVQIWNLETGRQVRVLAGHARTITGLAWAPARDRLVGSCPNGEARIWNVMTRACEGVIRG
jgi:WD40 repeat protein